MGYLSEPGPTMVPLTWAIEANGNAKRKRNKNAPALIIIPLAMQILWTEGQLHIHKFLAVSLRRGRERIRPIYSSKHGVIIGGVAGGSGQSDAENLPVFPDAKADDRFQSFPLIAPNPLFLDDIRDPIPIKDELQGFHDPAAGPSST
jgi:hypothetical protein